MYRHTILLKSYKKKKKYTSHTIACLKVFMCAFCATDTGLILEIEGICVVEKKQVAWRINMMKKQSS